MAARGELLILAVALAMVVLVITWHSPKLMASTSSVTSAAPANCPPTIQPITQKCDCATQGEDTVLREFHQQQEKTRQEILAKPGISMGEIYNVIVPEVVCPRLARVGNVDDGGKWMCDPWKIPKNCIIYSFGVGGDTSFETEVDGITGKTCVIHMHDSGNQSANLFANLDPKRAFFKTVTIGPNIIQTIMAENKHTRMDIMKMDIEGAEKEVLPPLLSKDNPLFCQIFVEIHGQPSQVIALLKAFSAADYHLYAYELNGRYPRELAEYCLIHKKCFEQYGVKTVLTRLFAT